MMRHARSSGRGRSFPLCTGPAATQFPTKFTVATSVEDVPVESVTVSRKV